MNLSFITPPILLHANGVVELANGPFTIAKIAEMVGGPLSRTATADPGRSLYYSALNESLNKELNSLATSYTGKRIYGDVYIERMPVRFDPALPDLIQSEAPITNDPRRN